MPLNQEIHYIKIGGHLIAFDISCLDTPSNRLIDFDCSLNINNDKTMNTKEAIKTPFIHMKPILYEQIITDTSPTGTESNYTGLYNNNLKNKTMNAQEILKIANSKRTLKIEAEYNLICSLVTNAAINGLLYVDLEGDIFQENRSKLISEGFELDHITINNPNTLTISWTQRES